MSLAAIHILKKELQLSDADYRKILTDVAKVRSAKELDEAGDKAVMRHLYQLREQRSQARRQASKLPAEKRIWGMWYELCTLIPEQNCRSGYLAGFINKVVRVDIVDGRYIDLKKLTAFEQKQVIEALKKRIDYEREKLAAEVPF